MSAYLRNLGLLAVVGTMSLVGAVHAESVPARIPARLIVEDKAGLFSDEAIDKAKKAIAENKGIVEREVHLETYAKLSEADQKKFEAAGTDKSKLDDFWREWTKTKASGERGLLIAINRSPGHVSVITSDAMSKFFTRENRDELQNQLTAKLSEAAAARKGGKSEAEQQKIRDDGLVSAMQYASRHIPESYGTDKVPVNRDSNKEVRHNNANERHGGGGGGMSVGG